MENTRNLRVMDITILVRTNYTQPACTSSCKFYARVGAAIPVASTVYSMFSLLI